MINAPLRISMTVKSKTRQVGEFFQPTITGNETFHLDTTIANFDTDFPTFLTNVWSYITSIWVNSEIDIHYTVRLENVTAPEPETGGWLQAKQNFDGQLSQLEVPTSQSITDTINEVITHIVSNANYN